MRSNVSLPRIETIPIEENRGIEIELMNENLLQTEFLDKEEQGRRLRGLLGIGTVEARSIIKVTGTKTIIDLVGWYRNRLYIESPEVVQGELQKAVISATRTGKIVAILILLCKV
jgi:hypothetical protein